MRMLLQEMATDESMIKRPFPRPAPTETCKNTRDMKTALSPLYGPLGLGLLVFTRICSRINKPKEIALTYPSQRFLLLCDQMLRQSISRHLLRRHPPEDVSCINRSPYVCNVKRDSLLTQACTCLVAVLCETAAVGTETIKGLLSAVWSSELLSSGTRVPP